jgi:dihydrofolate reductase
MRKVVAATFVSLDGVMQAPGGPEEDRTGGFKFGGWTFPYWDDAMGEIMGELFSEPFALLLGRKTYDIFAAYWPYQNDEIGRAFNAATKYVATRSDREFTWQNSIALRGDAAAEIERLKKEDGPRLLIQGSSVLIQSLQQKGLIDVYQLLIYPVVLGKGKRLFGEDARPEELKLERSKSFSTGVMLARYTPSGAVKTGSFAHDEPSPAELARRAEWAREG